tara:strand:+ start:15521 stop:16858 length:1338 start_codon:yes stop_codon:yes gene_type:complete
MDEIWNRRSDVCEASAHIMTDAMRDDLVRALRQISDDDRHVLGKLRKKGSAWIVGGWVRDSLMGMNAEDMDIATTLTPKEIESIFPKSIMVGASFGTVIVRIEGEENTSEWQVTTLRSEEDYIDGRRPEKVSFLEVGEDDKGIIEDLSRRDFTINSMAIGIDEVLIDPYGGLDDLSMGTLRTVGSADKRFDEDGLRVLRAFRFLDAGDAGVRKMDESLERGIIRAEGFLSGVSRERVGVEISKIFSGGNVHQIALKMASLGVFDQVFEDHDVDIPPQLSSNHLVNLALFFRNEDISSESLSEMLRESLVLSKNSLSEISIMHECRNLELDCSIESLRRFKAVVPEKRKKMIMEYLEKSGVDLFEFREAMEQADNEELIISPIINGDRLAEVTGLVPGPRLGKLKGWLHRKQIEGALRTEADLIPLLTEFNWEQSNHENWDGLQWP